ncbi:Uma2 family endonuclease [Sorangium sp. So ce1036]|uniref:Uma2 family endonuclease n=1 Tax=Sorangium sp. So ce1036 TaxID=3133328 RepID=UPI003F05510D
MPSCAGSSRRSAPGRRPGAPGCSDPGTSSASPRTWGVSPTSASTCPTRRPAATARSRRAPPALVVEVLSPHGPDRLRAQHDKLEEYQRFGVRRYWMVYPEMEMIGHFLLGPDGRYVTEETTGVGKVPGPGFEGLALDLDALWATMAAASAPAAGGAASDAR